MLQKWIVYTMSGIFLLVCLGILLPSTNRDNLSLYGNHLNIAIVGAVTLICLFLLYVTLEYRKRRK